MFPLSQKILGKVNSFVHRALLPPQLVMTAVEGSFSTEQDLLLDSCKGGKEIFLHMDLFFSGG